MGVIGRLAYALLERGTLTAADLLDHRQNRYASR
jgi:hypothetical protein